MDDNKRNKLIKLLPLLPLVMTLAGCGGRYSDGYISGPVMQVSDWFMNAAFWINSVLGQALYGYNHFLSADIIGESKTAYASFAGYVSIFQWIALAYVAIKFGMMIFKNYFTENQKYAVSSVSIIKKLVIALALTWAMPYAVFTGYYGASTAGVAVANQIGGFSGDSGSGPYYKLYEEMDNTGIKAATYCRFNSDVPTPPVDDGLSRVMTDPSTGDGTGNETLNKKLRATAEEENPDVDKYIEGDVTVDSRYDELVNEYKDVWNQTCGQFSEGDKYETHEVYRVGEAINKGTNRNILVIRSGSSSVQGLLIMGVSFFYSLVASVALIRRLLDSIMLVATGWYYVGNYVTDENGESLHKFLAQLGSVCVTQFTVLAEVSLYFSMQTGLPDKMDPRFLLASNLAWLLLLIGTPSAIASMFNQTGAVSAGAKIGSHIAGAFTRK